MKKNLNEITRDIKNHPTEGVPGGAGLRGPPWKNIFIFFEFMFYAFKKKSIL